MVYVEECFFCNAWSAIDKNQTCKKLRMLHFFLFWWLSQSTASLLYEWHLSELTNAITFLVGEQLQLVATATIGAASESLSCTFPSWLQLHISILMHLDLSCTYPSQWILILVAHLHLDTFRSQLCISILMRLDLSCASLSWYQLRISNSVNFISVAHLHLDTSRSHFCISILIIHLHLSCASLSWCTSISS